MTLGLRFWGVCIVVAGAALGGCNVDPGSNMGFTTPCHELQGDLTCQSLYTSRPYCSVCTSELQGCVMFPPATACRPETGSTSSPTPEPDVDSSGDTDASVDTTLALDTTGSSTGEPPCEVEGELDPGCMALDAARPFCIDSVCVGCDTAGGADFCAERDALTPACDGALGMCVACGEVEASVCGEGTPVCDASGECVSCSAHAQCPLSACHLGPDDPLLGHCFLPEEVVWVDNAAPCPGEGTPEEPRCNLQDALTGLMPGDARVLRIAGGTPYAERMSFVGPMTIAIVGTGEPELTGHPGQQATTLLVDEGVTAYVHGIHLVGNPLSHGIMCNSSYLRIEDSHVRDNEGWGMYDFEPCTVDMRQTVVVGNEDGGVRVAGGQLSIVNSTVGLNGIGGNATGVRIEGAEVDIVYSTIAGNDGSGADSIECTGATGTLRNNIITGVDGTSIELECFPLMMTHNAMDAANFASGTNVEVEPYNEIYFNNPTAGDFTISAPPLTPFGGISLWMEGDPLLDGDGTERPTDGSLGYAGADEP